MRIVVKNDLQELRNDRERLNKVIKTPVETYNEIDRSTVTLEALKKAKENQLNYLCNQTIVKGFEYEGHRFSYDIEAQLNFMGTRTLFNDGVIQEVYWTAYDANNQVTRVQLTKADFDAMTVVMLQHTNTNISKFRDTLMPQVQAAKTVKEVDSINW